MAANTANVTSAGRRLCVSFSHLCVVVASDSGLRPDPPNGLRPMPVAVRKRMPVTCECQDVNLRVTPFIRLRCGPSLGPQLHPKRAAEDGGRGSACVTKFACLFASTQDSIIFSLIERSQYRVNSRSLRCRGCIRPAAVLLANEQYSFHKMRSMSPTTSRWEGAALRARQGHVSRLQLRFFDSSKWLEGSSCIS